MIQELFREVESKLSDLYDRVSQLEAVPTVPSGGGGGGAPANAEYLVNSANATLTNEIVVTAARGRIIYGDDTPEWITLNHPGAANRILTTDANDVLWSTNSLQLSSNATLDYNGNTLTLNADLTNSGGSANQVAYWSGLNTLDGENQLALSRGGTGQDFSGIARGDIIVADATPDLSLLNIGASNTILQSDGNDPGWQTLSGAGIAPSDETYLVVSLSGNLTNERNININNGLTFTDNGANSSYDVNLGTPSSLSVTSTNNVTAGSHTHAVTASSDVSAGTAALLKSDANGGLALARLGVGASAIAADGTIALPDDGYIGNGAGKARLGFDSSGATDYAYFEDCNVGIGTTNPTQSLETIGAISYLAGTNTSNNTTKFFRFAGKHYDNSEEPVAFLHGFSTNITNSLGIGGGSSLMNAATQILFYTAANNTTTAGSEKMRIDSTGNAGINETSPDYRLDVDGVIGVSDNAGDPSTVTGKATFYGKEVGGTVEAFAQNDDGTAAQLTAHPDDAPFAHNPWAWIPSFSNSFLGVKRWYDIESLIEDVAAITGKQYIYEESIQKQDWYIHQAKQKSHKPKPDFIKQWENENGR